MFTRRRTETEATTGIPVARGGVSVGAVLTGVVVAFGSMLIFTAVIGGVLAATNVIITGAAGTTTVSAGIGAGIAVVLATFLSYLWAGYTAGRMGRGAGIANGILVPLVALLIGIAIAGVVSALGATAHLYLPFTANRLPVDNNYVVNWGIGIGIATLAAMFLGGAIGGASGARWHTKLEREYYSTAPSGEAAGTPAIRTETRTVPTASAVDLREKEAAGSR
jgi:hypothetical protein